MRNRSIRDPQRARILIADDHLPFAERCREVLEPEFEVVGLVTDAPRLSQAVTESKPDIVLIDISMPSMNGFELGDQVKAKRPQAKTIYMTFASGFDLAAEAFRRGAAAFVIKLGFPEELLIAVRRVIRGEMYLSTGFLIEAAAITGGCLPREGPDSHARRREPWADTRSMQRKPRTPESVGCGRGRAGRRRTRRQLEHV